MKKELEKKTTFLKCLVILVFPVLLCMLYCMVRGTALWRLYLPDFYNNDCLFYYKIVDGILSGGIPKGYFGYNESRALIGSFSLWSPTIVMPWVVFGLIFGWNFSSIFICNIAFISLCLALFILLTAPEWKNIVCMALGLSLFTSFSLHLLCGLPEATFLGIVIVFFGLALKCCRDQAKSSYIWIMMLIGVFLSIARPYMVMSILLPSWFLYKKVKLKIRAVIISILMMIVATAAFFAVNHYFCSPYFSSIFVLRNVFESAVQTLKDIFKFIRDAFAYGLTAGTHYCVAGLSAILVFIALFDKKEKKNRPVYVFYIVMTAGILGAILVFYRQANEGGRHLWFLAVVGCMLCALFTNNLRGIISKAILGALLIVFIARGSLLPTDYDIPIGNDQTKEKVLYWEKVFDENGIQATDELGYDNVVIWTFIDVDNSNTFVMDYKGLYALPKGMGISCCMPNYVIENIDNLKSKYLAADNRGEVAKLCEERRFEKIGEYDNMVLYKTGSYSD